MRIDYDFLDKHFVQWSLYESNKKPETSFKWFLVVLYRWLLYIEKFHLKTKGRTTTWSLRIGGRFIKAVVKTSLTVGSSQLLWMESLVKNIQLKLEFLIVPFMIFLVLSKQYCNLC